MKPSLRVDRRAALARTETYVSTKAQERMRPDRVKMEEDEAEALAAATAVLYFIFRE